MKGTYNSILNSSYNSIFNSSEKKLQRNLMSVSHPMPGNNILASIKKFERTQVLGNEEGAPSRRRTAASRCHERHPNGDNAETKGKKPPIHIAGTPSHHYPAPAPKKSPFFRHYVMKAYGSIEIMKRENGLHSTSLQIQQNVEAGHLFG